MLFTKITNKINLLAILTTNTERAIIVRGSASSFLIQVGFAGLSFITTTVLVHLLGLDGYGAYSNAVALAEYTGYAWLVWISTLYSYAIWRY